MDTPNLNPDKYRFVRALRPFSFSVALITCGLGIAVAFANGTGDLLRAIAVMVAGILLQAASNLANDHADLHFWNGRTGLLAEQVIQQIRRNFLIAGLLTLAAIVIGLWLVWVTGWPLFMLGLFGVIAGYFYTGEPIVYKHRGLGVPAVFLLTGVLMVSGAYYAVSGVWDNNLLWISLPVSLLAAALLVSNEIRDYLDDQSSSIRTLTVRMGFDMSRALYVALLLSVYPVSYYLYVNEFLQQPAYLLFSLLVLWQPLKLLKCSPGDFQLMKLPPMTGRFFLVFGVCFILSVF
ncbi:prenyltransferase [Endozoicomonas arenosclerae]|uniref:prenyltransferase n=1 Tax=Endozoicomonas arenosclerae TaxID=1633495 RepID=UPI0007802748|nr:prenyltransferase [Endozoicomonas arenosclerae]